MNPSTPKTERSPSTQLRNEVFGGSLAIRIVILVMFAACGWMTFALLPSASAQGTLFTYQGKLTDAGLPASGNYDLQFTLRNSALGQVGSPQIIAPLTISNGLFTVTLDFGYGSFDGNSRWLEIGVRTNGSVASYAILSPLQAVTPTPYAIFSSNAQLLNGLSPTSFAPATGSSAYAPATGSSVYVNKAGDKMTGTLTLSSDASWLNLTNPGVQGWNFSYVNNANLGSTPTLQIASSGSPLALDLPAEPGGMRAYLWPPSMSVPNLPHTSIKPTLAVYGDLLIGDIICIQTNPMTLFMRQETNLPASAATQFFSARAINNDVDGGAGMTMSPSQDGASGSGMMRLLAYGLGSGSLANSIVFSSRSGVNAIADRMIIAGNGNVGIGTDTPAGKLDVNGSIYQRGSVLSADYVFSPGYKLQTIQEHGEKMWSEKHLPAVLARKVDEEGREVIEIGSQQRGMLEELEKAHVYIQQLDNKVKNLEEQLDALKQQIQTGKSSQ